MRPITLKITAFGPYVKENIIDFTKLKDNNMFLITGPTGAGKTTIFDAISYALYGESSGGKREIKDLRSDFLEDQEVLTSIEFTFVVKGRDYFIRRIPKQIRKKIRGEGFVEQNEKVEFKELGKDEEILTKVTEVNARIEEIIGIKSEQFRKIVMIPQGDFREFLYSNTSEKEEILRRIFETDYYTKIQRKLKEESDYIEDLKEKSEFAIRENLKSIDVMGDEKLESLIKEKASTSEIIDKFSEVIKAKKEEYQNSDKELKKIKENIEKFQFDYNEGKNLNHKLEARDNIILEVENLEKKKTYIYKLSEDISLFNKAKDISIKEKVYDDKKTEVVQMENRVATLKTNLLNTEKEFEVEKKKYIKIPELKDEVEILDKKINTLESYLGDVKTIKEKKEAIEKLKSHKEKISNLKIKLEKDIITIEKKQEEKYRFEKDIVVKEGEYNSLLLESNKQEENLIILRELLKKVNDVSKNNLDVKKNLESLKVKEREIKVLDKTIREKRELYLNSAVINLANNLVKGEACPVCGSKEHPSPHIVNEDIPTLKDIEALQHKADDKQSEINDLVQANGRFIGSNENLYEAIKSALKSFREKSLFENLSVFEEVLSIKDGLIIFKEDKENYFKETIKKEGVALKEFKDNFKVKVKSLEEEIKVIKFRVSGLKNIEDELNLLKERFRKNSDEILQVTTDLATSEEGLKSILTSVPVKFQNLETLEESIINKKTKRNDLLYKVKNIEEAYNEKKISIEKLKSNIDSNVETKETLMSQLIMLKDHFEKKLSETFSDYESYKSNIKEEKEINKIEAIIKEYNEELGAKTLQLRSLDEELKDREKVNLEIIHDKIINLKEEMKSIEQIVINLVTSISNNDKVMNFVKEKYDAIRDMEKQYKVIGKLSKIANGRSFEKVTFETYVLVSYFDSVLSKANERFLKISGGRYYFIRKEDKRGGGKKGLDLNIYDNYTGKTREVKTLSGGESFNASLSLALGLSDEIQHNAGGVELNTIFIDEGFGTLDLEALDNAINVLMDLQNNGRLVGIISHVDELKERISSKLIIKKDKKGSSAYFKIV